jgi:hypothetical protein
MAAAMAAEPLANKRASSLPSNAAIFLRTISTVGLLPRVYKWAACSFWKAALNSATEPKPKLEDCTMGGTIGLELKEVSSPKCSSISVQSFLIALL